jgi:DNA-binding XRE family transcriptional regulator
MQAHTRKHHTRAPAHFRAKKQKEQESIHWEDAFKEAFGDMPYAAVTLKGYRNREGWTQAELCEKLGVSQANLSKMENGKRSIGKAMAKRLAEIFKTDYRMFL